MILFFYNVESRKYFAAINKPPYIKATNSGFYCTITSLYDNDTVLIIPLTDINKIKEYRKIVAPIFSNQPNLQLGEVFKQHFPELLL